jgi:serine/threonine-protein kinase HipA
MRQIVLKVNNNIAATLHELQDGYILEYDDDYHGDPLSLALPIKQKRYEFSEFPPFLDGLLPEGIQLEALLSKFKIDADDYLSQIILVGEDLVGAITVEEA